MELRKGSITLRNIAICGSPLSGKATLLMGISGYLSIARPTWEELPDRFATLDIPSYNLRLNAVTGSIFYVEEMLDKLMTPASMGIYVLSSYQRTDLQREFYEHYYSAFIRHHKSFDSIPWLTIINSSSVHAPSADFSFYPNSLLGDSIDVNARTGSGINTLISRIIKAVSSLSDGNST